MIPAFLAFLGHGGFKLLIFAIIVVGNVMKSRAKAARQREAELRGTSTISDFSTPEIAPESQAPPTVSPAPVATAKAKRSQSASDSPWSNNQNPFDS